MMLDMSLRHAVLGLLHEHPSTGYELTRKFDRSLGHAWHAGHSQIYPELAKLQEAGQVEVVGEGARNSRTYAVTDAGRAELRRWLTETEPTRSQRNETALRWFLIALLEPEERRAALEREIAYVQEQIEQLQELARHVDTLDHPQPFRPTIDLGLRMNPVMIDWLREQMP
jgi:PadR family transcriptional regulator, regulatory protein AphA